MTYTGTTGNTPQTASSHRQGLKIIEMQIHMQRENLNEKALRGFPDQNEFSGHTGSAKIAVQDQVTSQVFAGLAAKSLWCWFHRRGRCKNQRVLESFAKAPESY